VAKILMCKDLFPGCDVEVHAETEKEILQAAAAHVKAVHNIPEVDKATANAVVAAIKDE